MAQATPYKFLLAIDGSAHANRAAEYLARRAARLRPCEVHIVDVLAPRMAGLLTPQQQDLVLQAGSETVAARRMLDAASIAYRFHSEMGDPADRIVRLTRSQACDEVVVGSRGMSALDSFAFGSVAYKIVHLSPAPVTVVPNPAGASALEHRDSDGIHRILLPVDGSEPAAKAVEYVCALRDARIPVEVRLLNVQILIASGNVRRFVSQETIDAYCRAEGTNVLGAATKALQVAGLTFHEHIMVGHAGQTIASQASHWGCTRIVMGTRGLGALANVVVGSTALQVMHQSEIPVTLVK
jgi:nucleotide-binding universal stress UspA family protein